MYLRKYDNIYDVLVTLHWLPIKYRIEFKTLLIVFRGLHSKGTELHPRNDHPQKASAHLHCVGLMHRITYIDDWVRIQYFMRMPWHGNVIRITAPLCGKTSCHQYILLTYGFSKNRGAEVNSISYPTDTLLNNDVDFTSKRRHFNAITTKRRHFDVKTTLLLLRHVLGG